jgi:hypothetical protein
MPFSRFFSPWRLLGLVGATVGVTTTGCAPETTVLLQADGARAGALGDDGPLGALLTTRTIRVRGYVRNSNGPSVWVDHPEQIEFIMAPAAPRQQASVKK